MTGISNFPAGKTGVKNPYRDQPRRAFWRPAVAEVAPAPMADIYEPRFPVTRETRISTAGSCFAQHITRQFRSRGYRFMDFEPAPPMLDPDTAEGFGYGRYSARYGNIYSMRQLTQLFDRAAGQFEPEEEYWQTGDAVFDPFRPTIQPGGFASPAELRADRDYHLSRVRRILAQTDLFVFTFGLTEAWVNLRDGAVLPSCPGTHAGTFDSDRYAFRNFRFAEVLADAERFIAMAEAENPAIRFLFTVSPVPLTATASDQHVLAATTYSKSVLRAVCGELTMAHANVDYFPSYELVAAPAMRGMSYAPDMRGVTDDGVARVMDTFFAAHGDGPAPAAGPISPDAPHGQQTAADTACDEEVLDMFRS